MNDDQFKELLSYLNLSWEGYRRVRKGVKKRIARHMRELDCHSMDQYIGKLSKNPDHKARCDCLMTVSISRFFRDRELWFFLQRELLPELFPYSRVRIWSAGTACGEEAYSIQIVRHHLESVLGSHPDFAVLATDIQNSCLDKARAGVYNASSLKEIPVESRKTCFQPLKKQFQIKAFLKTGIKWECRAFDENPPSCDMDIIFMRNNLLTYYRNPQQEAWLNRITQSLKPGGYFIVGSKERLPENIAAYNRTHLPYVYRKKSSQANQ